MFSFPRTIVPRSNRRLVHSIRLLAAIGATALNILATASSTFGQNHSHHAPPKGYYQPVPAKPLDRSRLHHSSTALEGLLRGLALGIQAVGNFQLSVSQSAILYEHARSLVLDNRNRLHEFHSGIQDRRALRQAEARRENLEKRPLVYRRAYELSFDELDRQTGRIVWPKALRSEEFASSRLRLEKLFTDRNYYIQPTEESAEIERQTNRLIIQLRKRQRKFTSSDVAQADYLAAQKFLRGLKYESVFSHTR